MKVVVGLGNPGRKYENTRHNIGFEVVSELASRWNADPPRSRFESEICEIQIGVSKVLLVAPQTFMNLSGRAVGKLCDFYKLEPEAFTVVCDDMNLPVGRLRWRAKGSAGGQKGLLDITRHLGTQEVARLRIGVGRPPGRQDPQITSWVDLARQNVRKWTSQWHTLRIQWSSGSEKAQPRR